MCAILKFDWFRLSLRNHRTLTASILCELFVFLEETVVPEDQKAPPRRQSYEHSRPSVPKVPDNVDILVRNVDASEMDQMRAEMSDVKKELLKLKQEYREDVDRLLDEGKEDRKQLAELKIEVDSLKRRRADYWNPEKFF